MVKTEEILKILVQYNIIDQDQLKIIINEAQASNKKVTEVILDKKILDIEGLTKIYATILNFPYESLMEKRIEEGVINIIPGEVAENYKIICFDQIGNKIKVGIVDPDNFKAIEAVDFLSKGAGLQVEYFLISEVSFKHAVKQYHSMDKEVSSALLSKAEEMEVIQQKENKAEELNEITKSAPVAKIVSVIIRHAVEGGASDIHIEPLPKETRVRYRIDGVLHTSLVLPHNIHNALVARIKVMSNLKLDETRVPQDGRIKLVISEKEFDFRVSILPLIDGEKVVMRILDVSKKAPTLEDLGYEGIQLKVINKNMEKTEGLVLATGPTGSGKSTTLFALLNIINEEGINIATLEDPVEYQVKGVNQSQIKPEIGYTFAAGLRSFLRQDPDVIMVGEIRDEETAELAIHSALTGHLVLSTLHTTNAPGAITRLVDMDVEPFLLANTLHTVMAQRLARKICSHCKEETKLPDEFVKNIEQEIAKITPEYIKTVMPDFDPKKLVFYKGKGCPRCGNTGYAGRVAVVEVLDINDKLKELIMAGHKHLTEKEVRESQTFITMPQDGIIKVIQGFTTMEEILRIIKD